MKLRKLALAPIAAVAIMAFSIPAVAADTVYTIGIPNAALSPYPGPYGTATVQLLDSDDAKITFDSLTTGGYLYRMGAAQVVDVNVNAADWTVSNLLWNGVGPVSDGGAGNVSSFGAFNQTFDSFDGLGSSSTQISFQLHNDAGTWADSASVLTANGDGHTVAMHAFACCNTDGGAFVTGFATNGTPPIPEPETYAMMLAGLGLLGFVARRRRQTLGNVVPA